MTGSKITNNGIKIIMDRTFNSSPTYSAPSVFKIGTGTTNPSITDTDMETSVDITAGDDDKEFESSYPSIDETNKEVTIRMILNSTEANGNNLSEIGIFNTDGTELMYSHDVFTATSKSDTEEIRFIQKDKFEQT